MARKLSMRQAINEAMHQEMERDESVIVMGEDIMGGLGVDWLEGDAWGGTQGTTKGLGPRFGRDRVIDTPISESAFIGAAIGASTTGMRAIVELMYVDFLGVCFDQIFNQAAKFRYMFGGKAECPVVVRTQIGGGFSAAAQHSQCLYPIFTHIPGLKCVIPSNAYDAKGLLIEAIRDNSPVIFFEHKKLYDAKTEVPEESYTLPFGEAGILREGGDVTIVALARMAHMAMEAAETLAAEGIECEVIDPRTTSPMDEDTILESVENTGRLVVVDESYPRCSMGADISSMVAEKAFDSLKAPIRKVAPPHTPVPFSPPLEAAYLPDAARIADAVRAVARHGS